MSIAGNALLVGLFQFCHDRLQIVRQSLNLRTELEGSFCFKNSASFRFIAGILQKKNLKKQ